MASDILLQKLRDTRRSFFQEGLVDGKFKIVDDLVSEDNDYYIDDVIKLYFADATKLIRNIDEERQKSNPDYAKMASTLYQLKGASASVGAVKVTAKVDQLMMSVMNQRNNDSIKSDLLELKEEQNDFQNKIEAYFKLMEEYEDAVEAEEEAGDESGDESGENSDAEEEAGDESGENGAEEAGDESRDDGAASRVE